MPVQCLFWGLHWCRYHSRDHSWGGEFVASITHAKRKHLLYSCQTCGDHQETSLRGLWKIALGFVSPLNFRGSCSLPLLQGCEVREAVEVQSMVSLGHVLVLGFTLPGVAAPRTAMCTGPHPRHGLLCLNKNMILELVFLIPGV